MQPKLASCPSEPETQKPLPQISPPPSVTGQGGPPPHAGKESMNKTPPADLGESNHASSPQPWAGRPTFKRRFANRVWTSAAYKRARREEHIDPPKVVLLDTASSLGARCASLANREATPDTSKQPAPYDEILQCIWGDLRCSRRKPPRHSPQCGRSHCPSAGDPGHSLLGVRSIRIT